MAYATLTQVEAYIATTTISGVTKPTDTQTQQFITDRAALIDSALGYRGYVVPVTSPTWFLGKLAVLNAKGAAGDVLMQLVRSGLEGEQVGEDPLAREYIDQFTAGITELEEGVGVPVGLARQELQQSPMGFLDSTGAWGNNLEVEDDFGHLIKSEPAFTRNRSL